MVSNGFPNVTTSGLLSGLLFCSALLLCYCILYIIKTKTSAMLGATVSIITSTLATYLLKMQSNQLIVSAILSPAASCYGSVS